MFMNVIDILEFTQDDSNIKFHDTIKHKEGKRAIILKMGSIAKKINVVFGGFTS